MYARTTKTRISMANTVEFSAKLTDEPVEETEGGDRLSGSTDYNRSSERGIEMEVRGYVQVPPMQPRAPMVTAV